MSVGLYRPDDSPTVPLGPGTATDGELLRRFRTTQDSAAFAALVERYGPMVQGVCRRVLRDSHAADDVFQATFVVLLRKAAELNADHASLANWLYTVAYRRALKARAQDARRREREARAAVPMEAPSAERARDWSEWRSVLDEEMARLPSKYRLPLVLRYFASKSRDEVSRELGWTPGTVRGRLARGRDWLRTRLQARGEVFSAGVVVALLTRDAGTAVPSALLEAVKALAPLAPIAAAAAAAPVAPAAPALPAAAVKGGLKLALLTKAKVVLASVVLVTVAGGVAISTRPEKPAEAPLLPAAVSPPPAPAATVRPVRSLAFAADGQTLYAADHDRKLRRWSAVTGQPTGDVFRSFSFQGSTLAAAPGGQWEASASDEDDAICMWKPGAEVPFVKWSAHPGGVHSLAFTIDGGQLASVGARDHLIRIWEVRAPTRLPIESRLLRVPLLVGGNEAPTLAAVPDNGFFKDDALRPAQPDSERNPFLRKNANLGGGLILAVSPESNQLAILGGRESYFPPLIPEGDESLKPAKGAAAAIFGVDGKTLVTGHKDGAVRVWDLVQKVEKRCLEGHAAGVTVLALAPDGKVLASGDARGAIRIWDLTTGKCVVIEP